MLKVRGYSTVNHTKTDNVTCIDYSLDQNCKWEDIAACHEDTDDTNKGCFPIFLDDGTASYYRGDHPAVYSSAGSHAIFELECRAEEDATTKRDWCIVPNTRMCAFVPGDWQTQSAADFENQYTKTEWVESELPFEVITYQLIDNFDTNTSGQCEGLWMHKNDESSTSPNVGLLTASVMTPVNKPRVSGNYRR